MKRRATYTVEVPIKFTYSAEDDLSCAELIKSAQEELDRRLVSGNFDVLDEQLSVVDKKTHYTREEIQAQKKMWDEILASVHASKEKKVNVFVKIFKGGKL